MTTPTPMTETDEDRESLARGEIPAHIAMPSNVAATPLTDELLAKARTKKLLSSDPRLPWYRLAVKLERELAAAQERIRELEEWNRKMVEKAASGGVLDGYRELGVKLAAAEEWREAVLNELIVAHIYTREHDANPRKAVQDAITWNCQVALDPAVSSDARKLIEAAEARAEENARDAERYRQRGVLAKHCGVAEVKREWHTLAEWLYPGDEICLIDTAISPERKKRMVNLWAHGSGAPIVVNDGDSPVGQMWRKVGGPFEIEE